MSKWVGTNRTFDLAKAVYDPEKAFVVSWPYGAGKLRLRVHSMEALHSLFVSGGGYPLIVDFREDADDYEITIYNDYME